ncbi:MAG: exodeoxyribonuclease VII large subunit [Deltaproteobacteria bacterium]|nr:exodeoxyribonuclease VII large subunit [Deltaproteobacteria bacterium]
MSLPFVETEEEAPLTVSELVGLVGGALEREFSHLLVLGEITSFSRAGSGHCYLTLSDEGASVDAVLWRTDALRLAFRPQVGDEVVCRGRMGVFARQGRMQLYVWAMKPVGAGAAQRALDELRRRLAAEGLFAAERKRPLPYLPQTIGVVTSRRGAALHDILTTLRRRFAGVHVVLAPAVVQGVDAPRQIVAALGMLAEYGACDVVIVGRGGGASEDLAAFNDERVVRAIAAFAVPVVSAVGHEVDVSLCDLVADHRAATPTAAAEAVVPVREELLAELATASHRLGASARRLVASLRHRVDAVGGRLRDPATALAQARQSVDRIEMRLERAAQRHFREAARDLDALTRAFLEAGRTRSAGVRARIQLAATRLDRAMRSRLSGQAGRLAALGSKLDALSPLAVLGRGYSLAARADGSLVRSAEQLQVGETLALRFHAGRARAQVLWRSPAEVVDARRTPGSVKVEDSDKEH